MRIALVALVLVGSFPLLHAAGIPATGSKKEADRVTVAPVPVFPDRTADVRTAWVTRIGMGLIPSKVKAISAVACPDGGVAISGSYLQQPLTVKLGTNGETIWSDVFVDPDNDEGETAGVYVDSSGHVYTVVRIRKKSDGQPWTVVVKYEASGRRAWVTAHPGLHKASAVDAVGNVSLALSWISASLVDLGSPGYAIVRIAPDGQIKWRSTAEGSWGSGSDIRSVELDGTGNVFVTGLRVRYLNPTTVSTVSFDEGGSMRWGNSHGLPDDQSIAACFTSVDSSGAVVVVAAQTGKPYFEMVRYDPAGIKKTVRAFTGTPRALLREPSGNLFLVTGTDIQCMDTSFAVQWTHSRDGFVVFCSASGSLFVGGTFNGQMALARYDSSGSRVWSVRPAPAPDGSGELLSLVPDGAGNVTATGTFVRNDGGTDFIGYRLNNQGATQATLRYAAPPASNDLAGASCVDASGNTYIAGTQFWESGNPILFLAKVDRAGNTQFTRQVLDARASGITPFKMTVDGRGMVRVAGLNKSYSLVLLCFSDAGTLKWATMSTQSVYATNAGMKTDAQGTTIIFGEYFFRQAVVIAFDPAGTELWVRRHQGTNYQGEVGADMDAAGNVVIGATLEPTDNARITLLAKYAPDGQELWTLNSSESTVPLIRNGSRRLRGLVLDPDGRTIVALGDYVGSDSTTSLLTLCYSQAGELLWWGNVSAGRRYMPGTLHVGRNGDVFISGWGGVLDYQFLLRYDSQGKVLSQVETILPLSPEFGVVDGRGNLCLIGYPWRSYTAGEGQDIVTVSYEPTGSLAWVERSLSTPGARDFPIGISAGPDGMVISTGYSSVPVQDGPPQPTGTLTILTGFTPLAAPGSLVANPGFESELRSWVCVTNDAAAVAVVPNGEKSPFAARITIDQQDSNIVFYQSDIPLEPFAHYRLTFSARCNTGHDIAVSLIKHTPPSVAYGLRERVCDLGREWTSFSMDFFAEGFAQHVRDGRIMFRFGGLAEAGDEYLLDNIVLERIPPPDAAAQVRHPSDVRCGIGRSVELRVVAPEASAFQWHKNGDVIPGADKSAYATPVLCAADSGSEYFCRVTGPAGTLQTRPAFLYVRNEVVSLVPNWRFGDGVQGWSMAPGVPASFAVEGVPPVAHISVQNDDPGLWLMTKGIELTGGAPYRLSFRARSTSGHDLGISLFKHTAPYTAYAPGAEKFDLTPEWKEYTMSFTPPAEIGVVADARLMFWMTPYAVAGDEYFFDAIMLEEVAADSPGATEVESVLPPPNFALEQNSPNPFNPETSISFALDVRQYVRLVVYDLLGREVARLRDGSIEAGYHTVRFRANDMASGVYIYRLETPGQVLTKKMILLK
jgi:hypothetical protein